MKRLVLMLYAVAAVLAVLSYPALSEARIAANHNETLL